MAEDFKYVCECGAELPPSYTGPCPKCGESGRFHKDYKRSGTALLGLKTSASGTHKPKWSSESLALLFGFVAIFLTIVIPGILYLLPFRMGINFAILVIFLILIGAIFWWRRYKVLEKIRKLESKFGGEKKF